MHGHTRFEVPVDQMPEIRKHMSTYMFSEDKVVQSWLNICPTESMFIREIRQEIIRTMSIHMSENSCVLFKLIVFQTDDISLTIIDSYCHHSYCLAQVFQNLFHHLRKCSQNSSSLQLDYWLSISMNTNTFIEFWAYNPIFQEIFKCLLFHVFYRFF